MENSYGFIGMGAMGYPMAKNIRQNLPSTTTLWIFDVDQEVCHRFCSEFGGSGRIAVASSAKQVAENALTIVSIVPAGRHVRQVYLDPVEGIIATKGNEYDSERVYIECSTIDIRTAVDIGKELANAQMGQYIDCPVSGGVPAAESGSLAMLIGASETVAQENADSKNSRIQHVVNSMGAPDKQFYCGGLGFGLAAKICNNYLSCTILLANAEAMATGVKLGLDPKLLHKVIAGSTGQNFMLDNVCPVPGVVAHAPSSYGYRLGFKSQMLSKDIGLGNDAAIGVGIEPSIGKAAVAVFDKMTKEGSYLDRDASIVYRYIGGPDNINNA